MRKRYSALGSRNRSYAVGWRLDSQEYFSKLSEEEKDYLNQFYNEYYFGAPIKIHKAYAIENNIDPKEYQRFMYRELNRMNADILTVSTYQYDKQNNNKITFDYTEDEYQICSIYSDPEEIIIEFIDRGGNIMILDPRTSKIVGATTPEPIIPYLQVPELREMTLARLHKMLKLNPATIEEMSNLSVKELTLHLLSPDKKIRKLAEIFAYFYSANALVDPNELIRSYALRVIREKGEYNNEADPVPAPQPQLQTSQETRKTPNEAGDLSAYFKRPNAKARSSLSSEVPKPHKSRVVRGSKSRLPKD